MAAYHFKICVAYFIQILLILIQLIVFHFFPQIQPTDPFEYCKPATCTVNILEQCPQNNQVINSKGLLVACQSNSNLFHTLCPQAVTSDEDEKSNTVICKKSNTYQVIIG